MFRGQRHLTVSGEFYDVIAYYDDKGGEKGEAVAKGKLGHGEILDK